MKNGPLKVIYVENGIGYGGAAICLRHLVRNLDPSQIEAVVVTGRTGPNYEEIAQEATWKHIPDRRIEVSEWRRRLEQTAWIRNVPGLDFVLGQCVARLDDLVNFVPFFIQFLILTLRFRPHLIHVNNEPLCNRASILVGKLLKVPVVCHVRGNLTESKLVRWMYHRPDHFIPVSHWVSALVGKLGVDADRRTVVYDGIDLHSLDLTADGDGFRSEFAMNDEHFVVGLVGLLIPWKGQELFLDAARELKAEIPNLKMPIIGGTPAECVAYEQMLRQRVEDEGLQDVVTFTGHVNNMPAVYNALDVVVSASTMPEPLGTVVIECMAMGRTLVAPNHGGGAEMGTHDETALLFEPGSANAFAEEIRRLYRDPDLRARLGANARENALRTFDVHEHVRGVTDVYTRVLERRHLHAS
ncbi:MAG: glycosyltransferase family 4 protein [Gammaproteobacteria bacterium]|nr:glycosyltransferase family 4 protein [Gammaproteobacteria bacterium]